jgi:VanZ family protein
MLAYFLSSQDGTNFPDLNRFNLDKLAHFIEFSIIAFLAMRAISKSWPRLGVMGAFVLTVIGLVLFAASDERHQMFVPNRDCSFFDFIFDFMGTSAGILIFTHKAEEADEVDRELSSKIKGIIT